MNSGWPHRGESLTAQEPGPPENLDSDPGHLPEEDPEETSAQNPEVLSLGLPGLDTNQVPNWPGLRTLLQQLPPQDIDVGPPLPSFSLFGLPLFTYCGKNLGPDVREHGFKA